MNNEMEIDQPSVDCCCREQKEPDYALNSTFHSICPGQDFNQSMMLGNRTVFNDNGLDDHFDFSLYPTEDNAYNIAEQQANFWSLKDSPIENIP